MRSYGYYFKTCEAESCGLVVSYFFFTFSPKAIPPLFFCRLASIAFRDIGSVGRVEKKKKLKKGGLVPQYHFFGARKQQDMNPKSIWRKSLLMSL